MASGSGVGFTGGIGDAGLGFVTHFEMPGAVRVQLYEPRDQKSSSF